MDKPNNSNGSFSEDFLDFAYSAVVFSQAKSEEETKQLQVISMVCQRNGISFRKYMQALTEINAELAKLQQEDEQ